MARNISSADIKRLLLDSGGICAFPGCGRRLVSPDSPEESGAIIAELAHIVADSREGPRGNVPLSEEERNKHDNLIVLCPEHHKVVDSQPNTFSIQVLRQMKSDHVAEVEKRLGSQTTLSVTPTLFTESIQSTVVRVSHLPRAVYEAKCSFDTGEEEQVRERICAPKDHEVLLPFVLAQGKLFCFQNLQRLGNPFSSTIDSHSARPLDATEMWKDDDQKRLYVRLLNRSLYKYTGHRGVRFDNDHKRFYFIPDKVGESRRVRYKSLTGRNVERNVVWQPVRKKTGLASGAWWHVAGGLKFHQLAALQWCLSIRPEWHLTTDGQTPLEGKRVGRRVTSKKSRMFNYQYLREVSFWRDFLAEGKPRIILNFDDQSGVIESELVTFSVSWPGIPGDVRPFETDVREEDLFTLSELNEAVSGDEVEWEEEEEELDADESDDF
jgi:hypothetical protein